MNFIGERRRQVENSILLPPLIILYNHLHPLFLNPRRGRRDRMVVGFTATCVIGAYHHFLICEFKPRSWRGVLDTTLCDKVCQ